MQVDAATNSGQERISIGKGVETKSSTTRNIEEEALFITSQQTEFDR